MWTRFGNILFYFISYLILYSCNSMGVGTQRFLPVENMSKRFGWQYSVFYSLILQNGDFNCLCFLSILTDVFLTCLARVSSSLRSISTDTRLQIYQGINKCIYILQVTSTHWVIQFTNNFTIICDPV